MLTPDNINRLPHYEGQKDIYVIIGHFIVLLRLANNICNINNDYYVVLFWKKTH